jgi:hypothetical protein
MGFLMSMDPCHLEATRRENMPHIVVNDEQAKVIAESAEQIEIRDKDGRHLGYVTHGFTEEDIAMVKQRLASSEPRYTTQQVLDSLRSLDQQ